MASFEQVHTTIPSKYWQYAKNHKLSWSTLLIKAIELEMQSDPQIIKERLEKNDEEKNELQKALQHAEKIYTTKKTKLKDLHRGLIPVD